MSKAQHKTLSEAIAMIPDGASLAVGGWTIFRTPMAAAYEIIRQGKKDLFLNCSCNGTITDLLIGAGCIKLCEASWHGSEVYGQGYNFLRAVQNKKFGFIQKEESASTLALRNIAGAMGLPFIPCLTLKGSDILNPEYDTFKELRGKDPRLPKENYVQMKDPFYEGNTIVLVPASRPDFVILQVQEVGEEGTVRCLGPSFGDNFKALAGKTTIIIAEKIVSEEYLRERAELNTIPGGCVDVIVEVPYGAHPGGCYGCYDTDPAFYKEYVKASRADDTFAEWLKKWVHGVKNHEEYVKKLPLENLENIKADKEFGYNPNLKR